MTHNQLFVNEFQILKYSISCTIFQKSTMHLTLQTTYRGITVCNIILNFVIYLHELNNNSQTYFLRKSIAVSLTKQTLLPAGHISL